MFRPAPAFALLLAVAALSQPASAQAPAKSTVFSVRAGLVTPGDFYIEEGLYDSYALNMSQNLGVALDYRVAPRFLAGLFVDVTNFNAFEDESALMTEAGITLKAEIGQEASAFRFRPMLGLGYASLGEIGAIDRSQYLTLKVGSEIIRGAFLAEVSLYAAPAGGNADVTTSFGPVAQIRLGRFF